MSDLADFLLARVAEDEHVARESRVNEHLASRDAMDLGVVGDGYTSVLITSGRVLAECEAKRRIVALAVGADAYARSIICTASNNVLCVEANATAQGLADAMRLLALPYADHPDYREEWRP